MINWLKAAPVRGIDALILRITLAVVIWPHGAQKMLGWFGGHGFTATVSLWQQWFALPAGATILVILAEFFAPMLLLAGWWARVAAASIGLIMGGAIYFVHHPWGFFMNWYMQPERGEGMEYHLLVLGIVAAILVKGAGSWSLDEYIHNRITAR